MANRYQHVACVLTFSVIAACADCPEVAGIGVGSSWIAVGCGLDERATNGFLEYFDAEAPLPDAEAPLPEDSGQNPPGMSALKLAFFGDQGIGADARAVLQLVVDEGAAALIQLGDFAYNDGSPRAWEAQLSSVLGENFPVFAVVGNHDTARWTGGSGFQALLQARLERVPEAQCQGDYGVNASCTFRGVSFVLSGVGTLGSDHEAYLDAVLSQNITPFRLCLWHKNQHDMQVGAKTDEVGWDAYRVCAEHGVPIITAHEHSYARTLALEAIGDSERTHGVVGAPDKLELMPGRTAVAVAGLGGQSRRQRTPDHSSDSWWASIYAGNFQMQNGVVQGTAASILYGALFLEIGVDGDPYAAHGYFKTTDGEVHDDFTLHLAD